MDFSDADPLANKYKNMMKDKNHLTKIEGEDKLRIYSMLHKFSTEDLQAQAKYLNNLKFIDKDREVFLMHEVLDDIFEVRKNNK